jgi:peptidoglycan hydrolase-like protein with peptidoglycan-binding domain
VRRITVTNPDADPAKAKKQIDLGAVSPVSGAAFFDTGTVSGVKNIQQVLVRLGFLGSDSVTGYYGPLTTEAVKSFQIKRQLPSTGLVGPLTRSRLTDEYRTAN